MVAHEEDAATNLPARCETVVVIERYAEVPTAGIDDIVSLIGRAASEESYGRDAPLTEETDAR